MSRTRKRGKPPGYEFWSRRPGGRFGRGRADKVLTHRAERREVPAQIREQQR